MKKRLLYLIILSAMLASLTGCKDKDAENSSQQTQQESQPETAGGQESEEEVVEEYEEGEFGDFE